MTWFKVDDGLVSSRKVLSIPRPLRMQAMGLWVLAGAWSAREEQDGRVPVYMVSELGGTDEAALSLVEAGLWEATGDGWLFHNWDEWQPTRADLDDRREVERERKRKWREAKAAKSSRPTDVRQVSHRDTHGTDGGDPVVETPESALTRPDPTRPDPEVPIGTSTPTGGAGGDDVTPSATPRARAAKGSRIPEQFFVSPEMRAWAAAEVAGLDVNATTRVFVDYWRAESGARAVKRDWTAAWRNWLRRNHTEGSGRPRALTRTEQNLDVVAQIALMEAGNEPRGLTA